MDDDGSAGGGNMGAVRIDGGIFGGGDIIDVLNGLPVGLPGGLPVGWIG